MKILYCNTYLRQIVSCIFLSLVRPTIVHSLRRAGYQMEEIMKLTGHKSLDTLVRSYDFSVDTSDKVDMAVAIGCAPELSKGEITSVQGMKCFIALTTNYF